MKGHTSWCHHYQRFLRERLLHSLMPIFLSSFPDCSVDLSISSARSSASHWLSSSNSLVELLLAGLDAVGLLIHLWRVDTLRWQLWIVDIVDIRTLSVAETGARLRWKLFYLIPEIWRPRGLCQRQGTNRCWHLDLFNTAKWLQCTGGLGWQTALRDSWDCGSEWGKECWAATESRWWLVEEPVEMGMQTCRPLPSEQRFSSPTLSRAKAASCVDVAPKQKNVLIPSGV